jgi:DNA-binding transcriptional MerR regulator
MIHDPDKLTPDVYLTTSSVARRLKVTPDRVRAIERAGQLPCIRTATGVRLFRQADVDILLQRRMSISRGGV